MKLGKYLGKDVLGNPLYVGDRVLSFQKHPKSILTPGILISGGPLKGTSVKNEAYGICTYCVYYGAMISIENNPEALQTHSVTFEELKEYIKNEIKKK